ncbi:extracellular solute-binding protein [Pseudarthrobacter sp. NPDC092184]|uniref:ABC transporter substrate-binding protein n=1 Tax=unclassified Pseudarthrobacter TaxID=2647000 RepID=UPI00382AC88A
MKKFKNHVLGAGAVAAAAALLLSGCSGAGSAADGQTRLSFLVENSDATVAAANELAKEFTAAHPDIAVEVQTRPGGSEGDNLVKTKLATGDMADVFAYNSGSLFQQINPEQNLVAVTEQSFAANISDSFKPVVTANDQVYGVPFGTGMAGGVLYNKKVYEQLDLTAPKTWTEFVSNSEKIKDAGITPIIQTYKDTWTSQLFVLADFANVAKSEPSFAADFTAGKAKFATDPAAVKGFQRQEQAAKAGLFNKDFASATYAQGLDMLANGEGAQYPMLTMGLAGIKANNPEKLDDIGVFPLPGDDASTNALTVWMPTAVYVPKTSKHVEEAQKFQAFIASKEGCDVQTKAAGVTGPYLLKDCTLPADAPSAVKDMLPFFDDPSRNSPALEFLSPVKGPSLEQITVELGTQQSTAEKAAALYDEDVKKQAQQLNLPGWN